MTALHTPQGPPGNLDDSIPAVLTLAPEGKPSWLLSPYAAFVWEVTDRSQITRQIKFDVRLPNGVTLADYPHLVDSIRRIAYGVRTGPFANCSSSQFQQHTVRCLIVLARWMLNNQIGRFSELTRGDLQEYANACASGVHSLLNTEAILSAYLNGLAEAARFDADDTIEQRQRKAAKTVPCRKHNRYQVGLSRTQIMTDAGLEDVGQGGLDKAIVSLFDTFEAQCGFYQSPAIKHRIANQTDDDASGRITEENVRQQLMSFHYLYLHRHRLDDALGFPPFLTTSVRSVAQNVGKAVGRTRTVPVKQAAVFLERSIRWVLDYGPELLDAKDEADALSGMAEPQRTAKLSRLLEKKAWRSTGPAHPFPLRSSKRWRGDAFFNGDAEDLAMAYRQGMTFSGALSFLMAACAVVILSFTARRATEAGCLRAGCLVKDDSGKLWMRVFILKTVQEDAMVPVPEAVGAAILVLERLSLRARLQTKTDYLFQMNLPGQLHCIGVSNGAPTFRLSQYVRTFGYFVDVPPLEDGTRWSFAPHQFRRIFAILYVWIYTVGDWGALSYYLRHFSPEMTRRYVTDPELGHIIALAQKEHTAQILANAALGSVTISGAFGERLVRATKKLHDRMVQRIQIVPERLLKKRVERFVERANTTLKGLPWGYCAFSREHAAVQPLCAPDAREADLARATTSTCHHCAFHVCSSNFLPYLEKTLQWHQDIANAHGQPEILRQASGQVADEHARVIASLQPDV